MKKNKDDHGFTPDFKFEREIYRKNAVRSGTYIGTGSDTNPPKIVWDKEPYKPTQEEALDECFERLNSDLDSMYRQRNLRVDQYKQERNEILERYKNV